MEVYIRGVPPRETERSLNDFFGDILSHLHIDDWMCQKSSRKPFAKLFFLRSEDGERFLNLYGQPETTPGRNYVSTSTTSLEFKRKYLKCSLSREKDLFAIRSLEMTREARAKDKTTPVKAETEDFRTFVVPQFHVAPATITFKSKAIVVETDTAQRLEMISQAVESVVWEGAPTYAITLTLREAPRMSVCPDITSNTSLEDLFSWFDDLFTDNRDASERDRVPGLDKDHEKIAGSCLVYRFLISKQNGLRELTKSLNLTRGLPSMVQRNIMIRPPSAPYAAQVRQLIQLLSPVPSSLPFGVNFQLQKLAQNGYLSPLKVAGLLPEVRSIVARSGYRVCVNAIRRLFRQIPYAGPDAEVRYFDLADLTASLRQVETELVCGGLCSDEPIPSDQVAIIHKAMVTPSGIYLYGPEGECNNRILRKYAGCYDFFLRVQFCDEDGLPIQYNREISNKPIFERFKKILNEGFPIAGHHFSFLGFSHSSLRSQSCWFMAPFTYDGSLIYHNEVIKDLGDFSEIRTPAKCAARIGQTFSDTREAITFAPGIIKDNKELVDVERNGRVFSDGVGTISREALKDIWDKLPPGRMKPTILQIRCKGSKGVVALDSRLTGKSLFIRPSMTKFRGSTSTDVEICTAAYKASELRLNEQLIKILEDMEVEPQFFLDLQAKEIERLQSITSSIKDASKFLISQSIGDRINLARFLEKIQQLQLSFQDDNFLTDIVEAAVLIQLRTLKYKARIPVKDGFTLLGTLDETGILEEGQIFCIVDMDGRPRVITGTNGQRVIITRSPALHPGDVQLATAVTVPESSPLMQLRNCICFSQKGPRDLPSKLSGGDLDGDTFHIILDSNARTREPFEPADYARQPPRELDRPVTRQDMTDFFVDFMETDQLGRICNVHKMLADQSDEGVNDKRCIKLAEMASIAVDFSKTGIPVKMEEMPRYSPCRPHFMAPGPYVEIMKYKPISFNEAGPSSPNTDNDSEDSMGYKYYRSNKILGKLFDAIDEQEIFLRIQQNSFQHASHRIDRGWDCNKSLLDGVWNHIRSRCPTVEWKHHLDLARGVRDKYEDSLLNIMFEYGPRPHLPLSEIEVFIGDILGKSGALTTRQRELCIPMKDRFTDILSSTVMWIRSEQYDFEDEKSATNGAAPEHALELSMACLWVALNERAKLWKSGKNRMSKLRSFGYVAAALCLTEVERVSGY